MNTDLDPQNTTTDDGLIEELAAMRPEQTDVYARSLKNSVRRTVAGAQGEPFRLGRFTVLDILGGGGMGTVFVAYDPDLDRKIAVKVLHTRGQRAHREVLREGRALARLKHPRVVTVYEVGVLDDQVFLAMEYIAGVDLRTWLREPRTPASLLTLLVEAGEGLAAAHDVDLVHLDFKPENLLIDGTGHARVIDFGLARSLEGLPTKVEDTLESPSTLSSSSSNGGTPAYMPPERHMGSRGDHRSDQFSFCVTSWEALFGRRPRPGEVAPPGKSRVPTRVVRALRRGMSPDPEDRFPSMRALLGELTARPGRRWAAAGAVVAALGLTLGAYTIGQHSGAPPFCPSPWPQIAETWNDDRAAAVSAGFMATSVPFARDTEATVQRALDRYAAAWVAAREEVCEDTLVRRSVPQTLLDQRLACLEDRRLHLAALIERFADADDQALTQAVDAVENLPSIDACAGLEASAMFGGDPARVKERMALRKLVARARAEADTGRLTTATPLIEEALAGARTIDSPSLLAEVLVLASESDRLNERPKRAIERSREALTVAVAGGDPAQAGWAALTLVQTLAVHPDGASRDDLLALAEAFCRNAGEPSDLQVQLLMTQGNEQLDAGRYAEAIEPFERARALALESERPRVAALALVNLGNGRGALADEAGSIVAYRQALAELEPIAGEMHPWFANIHANIGAALVNTGKHEAALASFERAMEIATANFPADNRVSAKVLSNIALSYTLEDRPAEALAAYQEALAVNERVYGAKHYNVAAVLLNMATLFDDLGRLDEALAATERGTAIQAEVLPADHCEVFFGSRVHAAILRQLGRGADAVQVLDPLFEHFPTSECPPPLIGQVELELARTLAASPTKNRARALALLDSASGRLHGREALAEIDSLRTGLR